LRGDSYVTPFSLRSACRHRHLHSFPTRRLPISHALYGRYWGSVEHVPGLHFEACYYQAIEFCVERGIPLFEGGAQGEHKHARGLDRKSTRLNSSHSQTSYAVFCLKKKKSIIIAT